ncbi:kinase-like protein [Pisolithus marmoratus]|nr:kinase-like protein [Pisolithus marmoratus]
MDDIVGAYSQRSNCCQDIPTDISRCPSSSHIQIPEHLYKDSIYTSTTTSRTSISTESTSDPFPLQCIAIRPKASYKLVDFIIHQTLGTGSFGRVHLVRSRYNHRFYAIKVLSKDKIVRTKQVEHTNNEKTLLEAVQHPFIVNLWGAFQDASNLYMVMDFVPGGELFTLLRRSGRFPEPVAKFYAAEVALALNYLHRLDIIYRDLKPENILLNGDGHIKIADFGFAKRCSTTTWTLCGTPDYLAPEIVLQQRYSRSVDWYALGVLIFEMLTGLPPFHQPGGNTSMLYERILQGPKSIRWPAFPQHTMDLILKLMESDPVKRYGKSAYGTGDVFVHPWFSEVDWERLVNRRITAPYLPKLQGEGDASAFEKYPEEEVASTYGKPAPDPHVLEFPDFEYTSPTRYPDF